MGRITSALLLITCLPCCAREPASPPSPPDPARCETVAVGEAADLLAGAEVKDDRMVRVSGITDPRFLVWRDQATGNNYYITRVMGTGQRLFYMKQLATGEAPTVLSGFSGHMLRWDRLPDDLAKPVAKGLLDQYGINVAPATTYLVNAGTRPAGCPSLLQVETSGQKHAR